MAFVWIRRVFDEQIVFIGRGCVPKPISPPTGPNPKEVNSPDLADGVGDRWTEMIDCRAVGSTRGSREPGQALTGAALSGVLLCGALCSAVLSVHSRYV